MRALACAGWIAIVSGAAFGQSAEPALKFEFADVHASAKTANAFVLTSPARGGRYEVKNATMVDLVRIAYGFDTDKVLGGPSWLEMDRFDVVEGTGRFIRGDAEADASIAIAGSLQAGGP